MKATESKTTATQTQDQRLDNQPFFSSEKQGGKPFFSAGARSGEIFFRQHAPSNSQEPSNPRPSSPEIQHKTPNGIRIQRKGFGETVLLNSLDGSPPRAEIFDPPVKDVDIALELYNDTKVPIVRVPDSPDTVFVDYSKLRIDRKAFFEASNLTTTDFILTKMGEVVPDGKKDEITQRRQDALILAEQARNEITDTHLIDAYLQRSDINNTEKAATLGQMIVLHGKVEFLLSWIYEGGMKDPDGKGFENQGANQGAFPNHYQKAGGGQKGNNGGKEWCTSFAGYLYQTLGLIPDDIIKSEVFLSGFRLRHWATTGQDISQKQKTPNDQTLKSKTGEADSGAALIDNMDWKNLRKSLLKVPALERPALVDTFFKDHAVPQAGDLLIVGGEDNNFKVKPGETEAHSHTVIVESYDPTNHTISTIEGNSQSPSKVNDVISTQKLSLADVSDLGQIILLARPGIQFVTPPAELKGEGKDSPVDDFELMQPIASVIARLVAFASAADRKWICSDDPNGTVLEWMNGTLCNSE